MKQLLFLPLFLCLLFNISIAGTPGLSFSYYEGNWTSLPDFNSLTPVKTGVTTNISLDPRSRESQYAFLWQGYITIPTDGIYTFETHSDDGSKLYIGNYKFDANPIVNNDGEHADRYVTATITLRAGIFPFAVTYFQSGGGQTMDIYWSSNVGLARQKISDNVLTVDDPNTAGLNYSYFEGTFDTLPNFRTTPPVKSGVSSNFSLEPRNRSTRYAFIWQGNITIPAAGDYTFETYSDDGSKLYIGSYDVDTKALVENDFEHYNKTASGTIFLNAGVYPIAVTYFQKDGGDVLEVYWSSNSGISRQRIPDNVFGGRRTAETPGSSDGLTGSGNNYHFSSSGGDDSYTPEQAMNAATPWRTLDKLKSFMPSLKAGDGILLKRDDVFNGNIDLSRSGVIGSPIILSAYGTGSKPVINGLTTVSNWNQAGNGIWEVDCNSGAALNMVIMNGVIKALGRYPNYDQPEKGYLKYESHQDSSQITDNEFDGSTNWVGAELVVRKLAWVLDRGIITNQSGKTLTFKSPSGHEARDNFGYFIQNSPKTLDQLGEWYYNADTKKLQMYFGSENPDNYHVQASIVDTLLLINNQTYVTIDNISLVGGDDNALRLKNSSYMTFQNCDVNFTGMNALNGLRSPYITIANNTVNHTNNTGIKLDSACYFGLVRNNYVKNSGLLPGMGGSNNQQYDGIFSESTPSNIFELNTVDSSGYCGITFTGDLTIVRNNFVNHFCLTQSDGGGIYTWGGWNVTGRVIADNVVVNGMGEHAGTSSATAGGAVGIYLDDRTTNVDVSNNTIANCSRAGIFAHNAHEMSINGNTVYNNGIQLSLVHDAVEPLDPIRNLAILNNILLTTSDHQLLLENVSCLNDIQNFGAYDFNYYVKPASENGTLFSNAQINGEYKDTYYNLPQWQARFVSYDQHSHASPIRIPSFKVNNVTGPNKYPNGNFDNNINGIDLQSSPGKGTASHIDGKLDGGTLEIAFDGSGGATNNVAIYLDLGPVTMGRNYLVRFSLLGSGQGKTMKAFMLQNGAPWGRLSETSFFEFSTTRTENSFVFTAPSTESDVMIALDFRGTDGPVWIDNFQVNEADITFTNYEDYIRFEYNGSQQAKTILLDGNYVDVKNNDFSGNVTLEPYTSLILLKKSAISTQAANAKPTAAQAAETRMLETTAKSLSLSPNPVKDQLRVGVSLPQGTKDAVISIYTLSGVRVKTQTLPAASNNVLVDVSSLSSGIYFMNVMFDGHKVTRKFVK